MLVLLDMRTKHEICTGNDIEKLKFMRNNFIKKYKLHYSLYEQCDLKPIKNIEDYIVIMYKNNLGEYVKIYAQ